MRSCVVHFMDMFVLFHSLPQPFHLRLIIFIYIFLYDMMCNIDNILDYFAMYNILQIHELLEELAMVEEEIILLERKIKELKHRLCQERDHTMDWEIQHRRRSKKFQGSLITDKRFNSHNSQGRKSRDRRASLSSVLDIHSLFSTPRNSNGIYIYT